MKRRTFLQRASIFAATASFATFLPRRAKATSTIVSINSLNNVEMFNSTWGRPVALPSNWNQIRVGVLLHLTNNSGTAAGPSSSPILALGFCNNTTNMYGDANTTHFVGLYTNTASWGTAGGTCPALGSNYTGITLSPTVIVAGSQTTGTALVTTGFRPSYCDATRNMLFCDLTKGSPNYTFNCFYPNANSATDATITNFLANMSLVTPSQTSHTQGTPQTMAVNEATNGALNTANCYWNRTDIGMHLGAVAVAVLS